MELIIVILFLISLFVILNFFKNKLGTQQKQETVLETNILLQGGLPLEAKEFCKILFDFIFYPKLKISLTGSEIISSKNLDNYKNTNVHIIMVNFVKKFGCEYTQEDFAKLKELLHAKGVFLSDENILSLILKEKGEQDYCDFKKVILENNPVLLNDCIEIFVKNFCKEIDFLIKCKEKFNKYGIYKTPDGKMSIIENIFSEETTTGTFKKTTNLIPPEVYLKQVAFFTRKLFFFKELLLERDAELFNKSIANDEYLFREIVDAKNKYDLKKFEEGLSQKQIIRIEEIDNMGGYEFERFLKSLFGKMGYSVEHTKLTGDQGADLVINKLGEKTVVQAKRSNSKIGNNAIQEVVASVSHYKADKGMVVTNNFFTPSAFELAKSNKINLIDRDELNRLIGDFL
jgi:HJR/Mrr/RecB family endonuclease